MNGFWNFGPIFKIYHSTTRSMARFGLLALNNGKWKDEQIINEEFFHRKHQHITEYQSFLWIYVVAQRKIQLYDYGKSECIPGVIGI